MRGAIFSSKYFLPIEVLCKQKVLKARASKEDLEDEPEENIL